MKSWQLDIIREADTKELTPEDILFASQASGVSVEAVLDWCLYTPFLSTKISFGSLSDLMKAHRERVPRPLAIRNFARAAVLLDPPTPLDVSVVWVRSDYRPSSWASCFDRLVDATEPARKWLSKHACPLSLFVSLLFYANLWGLAFAAGFLTLLGIHEMGHKLAAQRMGIATGKPIFWPGIGALIDIPKMPDNAFGEAILGVGGPLIGSIAALLTFLPPMFGANPVFWYTLGTVGIFINLLNLFPIRPLDGGRVIGIFSHWVMVPGLLLLVYFLVRPFVGSIVEGKEDWSWPGFLPTLILIIGVIEFFVLRKKAREGYFKVPVWRKLVMSSVYVSMVVGLGYIMYHCHPLMDNMQTPEKLALLGGALLGSNLFQSNKEASR